MTSTPGEPGRGWLLCRYTRYPLWQADRALLQLLPALHRQTEDHRVPLPLLLHHDLQHPLGRYLHISTNIYAYLYICIYNDLTRATSSTAPWCEPCTAETLRLPRSVSLSTKYSTYYLLYIYYLFSMHSYNFNFSLTISNSNIPQCHIM